MKRLWHWLRRLCGLRQRVFKVDMRRREVRELVGDVCADGDFAAVYGRPDVTVGRLAAI